MNFTLPKGKRQLSIQNSQGQAAKGTIQFMGRLRRGCTQQVGRALRRQIFFNMPQLRRNNADLSCSCSRVRTRFSYRRSRALTLDFH